MANGAPGESSFVGHCLFLASSLWGFVMLVSLCVVLFCVNGLAQIVVGKKPKPRSILFLLLNIAIGTTIVYVDITSPASRFFFKHKPFPQIISARI